MSEDSPPVAGDPMPAIRAAFPSDPAKVHDIISGQLAQIAALQAALRHADAQRNELLAELTAARQRIAELEPPPSPYHQDGVKWVSADLYGARWQDVEALMQDKAALQEEARQLRLQRDAWQTLAAVHRGWAALQAPADRFGALCIAFAEAGLPLEQQAVIVAGLLEGEL